MASTVVDPNANTFTAANAARTAPLAQPAPQQRPQVSPVAPSDQLLLDTLPWLPRDLGGQLRLQIETRRVPAYGFIAPAMEAALLANWTSGTLQIATAIEHRFFGLSQTTILKAARATENVGWPAGSLEDQIARNVSREGTRVSELVLGLLGPESCNPWHAQLDRCLQRLVKTGHLEEIERQAKVLKFFRVTHHHYALRNVRANVTALSLRNGPGYTSPAVMAVLGLPAPTGADPSLMSLMSLMRKEIHHAFRQNTLAEGG